MDSKLNIKIDTDSNTFDTSSRNNYGSNQHNVIVLSDTDEEPILDSKLSIKINTNNNTFDTKNNIVFTNNLEDNNILVTSLENNDEFQEYLKTSLTGVASIYNVSGWEPDDAKKAFGISNIQYTK
ncbi:17256_t:CDS:2 [Gigaspora rosea]|nr:17256_t:CDS:2 [Gigaspora rosea]